MFRVKWTLFILNLIQCLWKVPPASQDVFFVFGEFSDQVVDHPRAHAHLNHHHRDFYLNLDHHKDSHEDEHNNEKF